MRSRIIFSIARAAFVPQSRDFGAPGERTIHHPHCYRVNSSLVAKIFQTDKWDDTRLRQGFGVAGKVVPPISRNWRVSRAQSSVRLPSPKAFGVTPSVAAEPRWAIRG